MNETALSLIEGLLLGLAFRVLWDGMWTNYFKQKYQPRPGHYLVQLNFNQSFVDGQLREIHTASYESPAVNPIGLVMKEAIIKGDEVRKSLPDSDSLRVLINIHWVDGVN